jgi:hypothetical protein
MEKGSHSTLSPLISFVWQTRRRKTKKKMEATVSILHAGKGDLYDP